MSRLIKLITEKKSDKIVTCKTCKYSYPVDAKHNKYYCIPNDGIRKSWLYYGEHTCEKGEPK